MSDDVVEHNSLLEAVHAVQGEMPSLQKTAVNPHFKSKYVSLDALMAAVVPLLNRHGLIWVTMPCTFPPDQTPALKYSLIWAKGGDDVCIGGTMALLAAKDDPQGQGSAITYARRYSLMAVLGLVADVDDDGNAATASRRRQQETRAAAPTVLNSAQLASMTAAITDAGLDVAQTLAGVGVTEPLRVTPAQAQEVRKVIDEVNELPVDGAA